MAQDGLVKQLWRQLFRDLKKYDKTNFKKLLFYVQMFILFMKKSHNFN